LRAVAMRCHCGSGGASLYIVTLAKAKVQAYRR
jgi:hypothetical protein